MKQPTVTFELLPKGEFLLKVDGKTHKGRFSMLMLDRFRIEKGLESYVDVTTKISVGMGFMEYAELIAYGLQDIYREDYSQCPWNATRVMDDVMEELGGMPGVLPLVYHCLGRLTKFEVDDTAAEGAKKKQSRQKSTE
jgi:hypothetical protein